MIEFTKQSIFQLKSHVYVNPVNCRGISGAGLALKFRQQYPDMYECYQGSCATGHLLPGGACIWNNPELHIDDVYPKYVWSIATMDKPGQVALNSIISRCILTIFELADLYGDVESIAVPALGCGIGRFSFDRFSERIIQGYNDFCENHRDIDVTVCEPR